MRYYEVAEQTPTDREYYLCYSEVHGEYIIAQYNPCRGWLNQNGGTIQIITHWLDWQLPLVYAIKDEIDRDAAEKYGINLSFIR